MSDPVDALVRRAERLREHGVAVGPDRVVTFCRAAALLDPLDPETLYWAAAATLTGSVGDRVALDRVFAGHDSAVDHAANVAPLAATARAAPTWSGIRTPRDATADSGASDAVPGDAGEPDAGSASLRLLASRSQTLRHRSFDDLSADEAVAAAAAIRRLAVRLPERPARRRRPVRAGRELDLRRTVRRSLRTQGEPLVRAWRDRSAVARRLVLVLDVSASMSAYTRALLLFGFVALHAGRRVDVFCFGTRLTRVTDALRSRHPDAALNAVAERVADWDGGTRIGESLKALLDRYATTALLRGSVVVLLSDGLDRGDPDLLAAQVRRLGRLAHRLVWVNPLAGSPRYEPLARGMAAALPHVDVFLSGHNLASLEELCRVIAA